MTDQTRAITTRRALLTSALIAGVAGCTSPDGLVGGATGGSSPAGAASPTSSTTPSGPTSDQGAPALGVQRFGILDTLPGADVVMCGARAAILSDQNGKAVVLSSVIEGARPMTFPELAGQTPRGYTSAAEMLPDAPPATSMVVLARKAGSGLEASEDMVTCLFTPHLEGDQTRGEFAVPKPDGRLAAAVMISGVTVVTILWKRETSDYTSFEELLRVAFDSTGTVLWQRTDENHDVDRHGSIGQSLTPHNFIALPGSVMIGVGFTMLTLDIRTGKPLSSAKGPSASGVSHAAGSFFGLFGYEDLDYGTGQVVFLTSGKELARHADSVAIDPIKDTVAIGYNLDAGDPGLPTALETDPALVVLAPSGEDVFRLARDKGRALGKVKCLSAFDGRLVVATNENLRILRAADGSAEPGFETAPGQFLVTSLPIRGGVQAQMVGYTSSTGEVRDASDIVVKGTPLTWEDLNVKLSS